MSVASEVRAALIKQPGLSHADILEECSGDTQSKALATTLKQMLDRGEVTREGNPGTYTYTLVADYKGGHGNASTPRPNAARPVSKAPRKPKSQPTTAKSQRKTAISVPARVEPDDNHVVALQADGSVFLLDKSDGTYQTLPGGVVQQIISLAGLVVR
jgi:hypothetical protein